MPYYLFENPKTQEVKEIFQHMNDKHLYEEDGVVWNRIFTKPTASVDTQIDPFSSRDFIDKTKKKSGMTMGEAFDESQRLSDARAKISGSDPIKDKVIKDYETKTQKKHPSKIKKDISI